MQVAVGSSAHFDGIMSYMREVGDISLARLRWFIRSRIIKIFGGDAAVTRYEQLSRLIIKDGFVINARIPMLVGGGTPRAMVYTASRGLTALVRIFENLKPDIVLINGDRFEILPVAIAAAYMNIRIAHIEGGDVSGTIDNSIRHAVSKFAHIHFPATALSAQRLIRMGENPQSVFALGSPIIDALKKIDLTLENAWQDRYPAEIGRIDLTEPYVLIAHHPVTTEYDDNYRQMKEILSALDMISLPQFFIAPNIDAGSDGVARAMREYRSTGAAGRSVFHKHVTLEEYIRLLSHASVAIGNSSSFIREGAYLGVPSVIVGTRQKYRERSDNCVEVAAECGAIHDAIRTQIAHGRYDQDTRFGDGTAAERIATTLATLSLETVPAQKHFYE